MKTRTSLILCALAVLGLVAVQPAHAAAINWNILTAGSWSLNTNWLPNTVGGPDAQGAYAVINTNIAGNRIISLYNAGDAGDNTKTIGQLDIGDTNGGNTFTIATGTGAGVLNFDNGVSNAQLNELGASKGDTISAPITLSGSLDITNASANTLTLSTGGITAATVGTKTITLSSGNLTVSGIIGNGSGTVAVTQSGAGTLILSGANTFSGGVKLEAGTLNITTSNAAFGTGTLGIGATTGSTAVTLNSLTARTITNPVNINQDFTYTGTNTLAQGTGAVTLVNGTRTITVSNSTLTLGGAIGDGSSGYGLTKAGAGILTLSGVNTYTGDTVVSGGTLTLANAGALSGSTLNYDNQGGTLSFGSLTAATFGGLKGGQNLTNTVALTVGGNDANTTYAGVLSGTGGLTKAGAGTLILSNANTHTGDTTTSAGTLELGNNLALQNSALAPGAGTLAFSGGVNTPTFGGLTGPGNLTLAANVTDLTLNLGTGVTKAYSGDLGSATPGMTLTKNNDGTQALAGENTYTGATTVNAGTLQAKKAAALPNNATQAIAVNGTSTLTVSVGSWTASEYNWSAAELTNLLANANVTFAAGATLAIDSTSGAFEYAAAITKANMGLTKLATTYVDDYDWLTPPVLTLSGNNTYSGLTTVTNGVLTLSGNNSGASGGVTLNAGPNNEGRLNINNAGALGTGTFTINSGRIDNSTGAAITNANINAQTWNGNFTFLGTQDLDLGTGAVSLGTAAGTARTVTVSANTLTVGGVISDGTTATGLTKTGGGTLVLSGANAYTGATTINNGILSVGADNNLGNANPLVFNGGTLQVTGVAVNNFGTHATTFTAAQNVGLDIANAGNTFTVGQVLNQTTGGLTKAGAGTLVLTQANTYTGNTTLSAGTLELGNNLALQNSALDPGAGTLTCSGGINTPTLGGILGATGLALPVNITDLTLDVGSGTKIHSGNLTGGAAGMTLTKNGAGGQLLTSTSYTGMTTVNLGALTFAKQTSLNGDIDNFTPTNVTVASGAVLAVGVGDSASGYFDSAAIDTVLDATHMGQSTALTGLKTGAIFGLDTTNATAGTFTHSNAIGDLSGGNVLNLAKLGAGTLVLNATNLYTGNTTISQGALSITSTAALPGWNANGRYSVASGASLAVDNAVVDGDIATILGTGNFVAGARLGFDTTSGNRSYGVVLANTGAGALGLTQIGANTLTLTGVNTYTGDTAINAGTLEIGGAGQLNSGTYAGNISIASGATFKVNSSANQILQTGIISGEGDLIKDGAGTLTLKNWNSFTGDLIVNGGTLAGTTNYNGGNPTTSSFGNPLVSRSIIVNNGGTLQFAAKSVMGDLNSDLAVTLEINAGGVADLTVSGGICLGPVILRGGTLSSTIGSGVYLNGTVTVAGSVASTISAPVALSCPTTNGSRFTTFDVGDAVVGTDLTLSGGIGAPFNDRFSCGLIKTGPGTMLMSAASAYANTTTVNGGTLIAANNTALGFGAATLVNAGGATIVTGAAAAATLDLTGATTVNEPIVLNGGANGASLLVSSGTTTLSNGVAEVNFTDKGVGVNGAVTFSGGGGGAGAAATFTVVSDNWGDRTQIKMTSAGSGYTSTPTVSFSTGSGVGTAVLSSVTLTGTNNNIGGAGNLNIDAIVGQSAAGAGFTKIGAGTLNLAGVNTYSGATTISDGTLKLTTAGNNNIANSPEIIVGGGAFLDVSTVTGAGGFQVVSGQTLSGTGTVTGNATVNSGGTLAPGASVGTLTFNNDLTFGDGGNKWVAELLGAAADRVDVTGTLTLGDATALELVFGAADPFQAGTYTLADCGTLVGTFSSVTSLGAYSTGVVYDYVNDTITIQLLAGLLAGDANLDRNTDALDYVLVSNNYNVGSKWTEGDVNGDGAVDALDYVAISNNYGAHTPEPATLAILAMGGAWVVFRRRRQGTKGACMRNVLKKMGGLGAAVLALVVAAGACQASVSINLTLAADTMAKTWTVYATLTDPSSETLGLHGIYFDAWGSQTQYGDWTGGLAVDSITNDLPQGWHTSVGIIGFGNLDTTPGTPTGTGFALSGSFQSNTHKEKLSGGVTYNNILKGVGETSGSAPPGITWAYPVLVAEGTYTGSAGWLNVSLRKNIAGTATSVTVLPATLPTPTAAGVAFNTFSPMAGDNYRASVYIPEPATLALLGLGGLGLILNRKRR